MEVNSRPRTLLPNSSEETFLLPGRFLTELDPQFRLLTLPNFGVNREPIVIAPERMRVKTPCTWRMKSSPSKTTKAAGGKKRSREEAVGSAAGTSPPVSPPRPDPNHEWKKSKAKT
jgi:hypothetical protein